MQVKPIFGYPVVLLRLLLLSAQPRHPFCCVQVYVITPMSFFQDVVPKYLSGGFSIPYNLMLNGYQSHRRLTHSSDIMASVLRISVQEYISRYGTYSTREESFS